MRKARTLIVEHDEESREATTFLLTRIELDWVAVGDAEAALTAIRQEPFDLVLLDMELPATDGFQVLARIRESEKGGHYVPVFAIAGPASGRPEEYLTAGFDGYLAKPFQIGELTEAIRRFLQARTF